MTTVATDSPLADTACSPSSDGMPAAKAVGFLGKYRQVTHSNLFGQSAKDVPRCLH